MPLATAVCILRGYFIENDLVSQKRLDFKQWDSSIGSIFLTYKSLDLCSVFVDVFKHFYNVWHDSLTYRSDQNKIADNFFMTFCKSKSTFMKQHLTSNSACYYLYAT